MNCSVPIQFTCQDWNSNPRKATAMDPESATLISHQAKYYSLKSKNQLELNGDRCHQGCLLAFEIFLSKYNQQDNGQATRNSL